jgi:hypothetical protein
VNKKLQKVVHGYDRVLPNVWDLSCGLGPFSVKVFLGYFDIKWSRKVPNTSYPYKSIKKSLNINKIEKGKNRIVKNVKTLKVLHWNCNGVVGKEKIDKFIEAMLLLLLLLLNFFILHPTRGK